MTDYPHAETPAAKMLAQGLRMAAAERNLSLRQIGRNLGYNQPVVLSHMATGRVPIPIDRAVGIAEAVGMPAEAFLEAVLEQRHPAINWRIMTGRPDPVVADLEQAAGKPLSALSAGHHHVLREVVQDRTPEERWIAIPEIAAVKLLRKLFPNLATAGFSEADREKLRAAAALRGPESVSSESSTKR